MHKYLDGHPDELATKVFRAYKKSKRREWGWYLRQNWKNWETFGNTVISVGRKKDNSIKYQIHIKFEAFSLIKREEFSSGQQPRWYCNVQRPADSHLFTLRSDIVPVLLCGQEVTSGTFPGILIVSAESQDLWEFENWQLGTAIT
jgi:hypothetical protein